MIRECLYNIYYYTSNNNPTQPQNPHKKTQKNGIRSNLLRPTGNPTTLLLVLLLSNRQLHNNNLNTLSSSINNIHRHPNQTIPDATIIA